MVGWMADLMEWLRDLGMVRQMVCQKVGVLVNGWAASLAVSLVAKMAVLLVFGWLESFENLMVVTRDQKKAVIMAIVMVVELAAMWAEVWEGVTVLTKVDMMAGWLVVLMEGG